MNKHFTRGAAVMKNISDVKEDFFPSIIQQINTILFHTNLINSQVRSFETILLFQIFIFSFPDVYYATIEPSLNQCCVAVSGVWVAITSACFMRKLSSQWG